MKKFLKMKKFLIIIFILIVIVSIAILIATLINEKGPFNINTQKEFYDLSVKDIQQIETSAEQMGIKTSKIMYDKTKLATVNGLPVYPIDVEQKRFEIALAQIEKVSNGIDYSGYDINDDKQVLKAVVEELVLVSEAKRRGIDFTFEEVYEELKEFTKESKRELKEKDAANEQIYIENKNFWSIMDAYQKGLQLNDDEFVKFFARSERIYKIRKELYSQFIQELMDQNMDEQTIIAKGNELLPDLMKKAEIVYY